VLTGFYVICATRKSYIFRL